MPEAKDNQELEELAPQKLLGTFSKNRVGTCLVIASALHVLVIGGTSLDYVYYNWINKAAGEARAKRLVEEKAKLRLKKKSAAATVPGSSTNAVAAGDVPSGTDTNAADVDVDDEKAMMDKYKDSPVVKRVTDTAKPDEIPPKPDDLEISVEDTNPF